MLMAVTTDHTGEIPSNIEKVTRKAEVFEMKMEKMLNYFIPLYYFL
jgi:hypothetical protein